MTAKPTAIDLFCGAGGLSLGLAGAGFDVRAAVDNDRMAVRTYRENIGEHVVEASLTEMSPHALLEFAGLERGECTLLAGGPPCQGFSVKRRGEREDPRNDLLMEFFRYIDSIEPRYFLVENVKGLLSKHGRPYLNELIGHAECRGYRCHIGELDAVDFGVPQFRQRAFLVGEFRASAGSAFRFPEPTVDRTDRRTVWEAIGDLPTPPADGSSHPDFANHYREARLSRTNLERIRHVPPGGGREHLPKHLQLPCHQKNDKLRHVDVYGRLSWEEPSVTVTARFDSFTRGRFGHPVDDRSLTLREGARLQTFPDEFVFYGNREECARQIGNAVPPMLGEAIGRAVLEAMESDVDEQLAGGHRPLQGHLFF